MSIVIRPVCVSLVLTLSEMCRNHEPAVTEVTWQVCSDLGEVAVPDIGVGPGTEKTVSVHPSSSLRFQAGLSKQLNKHLNHK